MTSKIVNVLGATRLSRGADKSTSIERQSSGITGWADLRKTTTGDDYRVIHISEDSDVSGAVSPFERAGLGPYLTEPLLSTWQVLVVFRLDRLTRSIADFETVWKFLESNGRTLVSVAEQIDFGTTTGRLMARQLVTFAEYEREIIRARIKNAYDTARANGRYPGMQFPFGYMPVRLPGKGWGLEPHPVYGPIVGQIADRLIAGESLSAIARWLDTVGIPTPRNAVREYKGKKTAQQDAKWNQTSLTAILKSPAIIGETSINGESTHKPQALRDETGMAVKRAEPLIDREKWERVKKALSQKATRRGPNVNRGPLLRVAYCADCGSTMILTSAYWNGKTYRYYRCSGELRKRDGCTAKRIVAEQLESQVEDSVLEEYGDEELTEVEEIAGVDYSTQMHELAEAIGALSTKIVLGRVNGQDVSALEEQQRIHEYNLSELASQPISAPQKIERQTGEKFGSVWKRLDWNGRNDLLRRYGITRRVKKEADGYISVVGGPNVDTFEGGDQHAELRAFTYTRSEQL